MADTNNPLGTAGPPLFYRLAAAVPDVPAGWDAGAGEAVRIAAGSLSVMQKEGWVRNSRTGAGWRLASDEGDYLGGHDVAPCPLSFFSTGMVCSFMDELLALAERRGITLDDVELAQDNYYTMRGSALKGTMVGGAKDVTLRVRVAAGGPDRAGLERLAADAVAAAPVHALVRGVLANVFTLTHNGTEIEPDKVTRAGVAAVPDAGAGTRRHEPAPGDWDGLVTHTGRKSPRNEHTKTFAGGSLAAEQDRLLHLHVVCRQGADGVREVTQFLHNPHGSEFRFRVAAPDAPLAPDPASMVAAGLAFCFMTQFGRYCKIVGKELDSYRVVQDMHCGPGGATGATGVAGTVAPVVTHCHLESAHGDDFARAALAMAEQTCFLHALCRTDLRVRVGIEAR